MLRCVLFLKVQALLSLLSKHKASGTFQTLNPHTMKDLDHYNYVVGNVISRKVDLIYWWMKSVSQQTGIVCAGEQLNSHTGVH